MKQGWLNRQLFDCFRFPKFRTGFLLSLCFSNGVFAAPAPCPSAELELFPPQYNFQGEITPGVSWKAWSELLNVHWTKAELEGAPYNSTPVKQAITTVVNTPGSTSGLPSFYYGDTETFTPSNGGATDTQRAEYEAAAKLYKDNQWNASIPLFDLIARDQRSPYRAAAAYSAARAALKAGQFSNGIDRINAIVGDPTLSEFHAAAYHLVGVMAARTGSMPLIAAKYAEMSHMFMAPVSLLCSSQVAADVFKYQSTDLLWYLVKQRSADSGSNKQRVLDILSDTDPVLDLLRVLAAPTPFKNLGWPHSSKPSRPRHVFDPKYSFAASVTDQWGDPDGMMLTAHAREKWIQSKNPLWGFALAQRTADPADIPLLLDMLKQVDSLPELPGVDAARSAFYWQFMRQSIRLLVMSGKTNDAIKLITKNTRNTNDLKQISPINASYIAQDGLAILNGPIRWFLENYDLPSARHWASEVSSSIPGGISDGLIPLLATDFSVLARHSQQSAGFWIEADFSLRRVLDLLPARKLAELSAMRGVDPDMKRAMLGAAFVRFYMLERWPELELLLPEMSTTFPELKGDLDQIQKVTSERQRQYLVARLLLRSPGLVPYVAHARILPKTGSPYGTNETLDLFSVDSGNPNDGNWWCPPQLDELKIALAQEFYGQQMGYGTYSWGVDRTEFRKLSLDIGDKLIAWHPLLKDVDLSEIESLAKTESGPKRLSEEAVSWANSTPRGAPLEGVDKAIPETLALAVRSTRYGCRRSGSLGNISRKAFVTLHARYPQSAEAHKTPYWFDSGH
jgi:hypothetical protein